MYSLNIDKAEMIFGMAICDTIQIRFKLIAGIAKPTTGKVWMSNRDISSLNQQPDRLVDNTSVLCFKTTKSWS